MVASVLPVFISALTQRICPHAFFFLLLPKMARLLFLLGVDFAGILSLAASVATGSEAADNSGLSSYIV